jgi:hypothetical protein
MKTSFLLQAVLGAALALPLALQAQGQRPIIVPDDRYPTRPGQGSYLIQEVESLQSTTRTLHQAFVAYCKRYNVAAASPDGQLMRALVDLQLDVSRLASQIRAHANNINIPLGEAYRSFHMAEYSSRDSQLMAVQAGFVRSMYPYFRDIDQHLSELGRLGYRNPMLRPIEMDGRSYSGRGSGVQERPFDLPPLVLPQPMPSGPVPPRPDRDRERDRDDKIDLGDVLKQLFRGRLN